MPRKWPSFDSLVSKTRIRRQAPEESKKIRIFGALNQNTLTT